MKIDSAIKYEVQASICINTPQGTEVWLKRYNLYGPGPDSTVATEVAKNLILNSDEFKDRKKDIVCLYVITVDVNKRYDSTEYDAQITKEGNFDVVIRSYPETGMGTSELDGDFYADAEMDCRGDCDSCHKHREVLINNEVFYEGYRLEE